MNWHSGVLNHLSPIKTLIKGKIEVKIGFLQFGYFAYREEDEILPIERRTKF